MQIPDDKVLTSFLITCFTGIFEGLVKPLENNGPKNVNKFKYAEGDLTYLETTAGGLFRYQTDIRVFLGPDGDRTQIWGMNVSADIIQDALRRARIAPIDLRDFLYEARTRGFVLTRDAMENGRRFCLFDIPKHERAGPRPDSALRYEETIDDSLDFFGGTEEITYRTDRRSSPFLIYRANFQGGRL